MDTMLTNVNIKKINNLCLKQTFVVKKIKHKIFLFVEHSTLYREPIREIFNGNVKLSFSCVSKNELQGKY